MRAVPVAKLSSTTPETALAPNFPSAYDHSVQFYTDDSALVETVSRFLGAALGAGESGIVIATRTHREALAIGFTALGLNVAALAQPGRLITLDAAETLTKFMLNGLPDSARFHAAVGDALRRAQKASLCEPPRVAAFGEMVALLWAEGNIEAALRLEQLWNELAVTFSFRLHCAYPLALFPQAGDGEAMLDICAQHSRAVPTESYTSLPSEDVRQQSILVLQQKALALETEIARRKAIQQRLQEREKELTDFLENTVIGMHWVDANGIILWANQAEMHLLGYERDEYIGHRIAEFHADPPVIEDILRRLASHEELHAYQARLRCKDGSIRFVRIDSNVYLQDGKFVHTRCFTVDITGQRQAEEARARLAAIVECSDDAIAAKDLNGIVTSWNAAAERMFGYKAEDMVGRPISLVIPPELQAEEGLILQKIRAGEKIDHFETTRITRGGERIEASLSISPIRDQRGNVVGAAKIIRNITEGKKLARALHVTEKLASVGRLAATVAHEINNPLEAVTNLVYLARTEVESGSAAAGHLEIAEQELNRVAHISRQTLGFYRDTTLPSRMNVSQVCDDLLFLYGRKLLSRGIKVCKQYGDCLEVDALEGEIRQAFSNLIVNAIDAMPAGGLLTFRGSPTHLWHNSGMPGIRMTIADTGTGIEPQHRTHLFEPFYTTKKDVGTGLGLWITHGIINKHGGKIQVRSQTTGSSRGTVFSVFLPLSVTRSLEQPANFNPDGESRVDAGSETGLNSPIAHRGE